MDGFVRRVAIVVGGVLVGTGVLSSGGPAMSNCSGACGGYQDLVMDTLRACPKANELLGEGIGPSWVGCSCGQMQTAGATGNASWSVPVAGSRARGTYDYAAEMHGGRWQMTYGTLDVDGANVDILACGAPVAAGTASSSSSRDDGGAATPEAPEVEQERVTLTWAARVRSSTGAAPAAGAPCTLTAVVANALDGPHEDRLTLQCQGRVLYDSSVPLEGMANANFGLREEPVAGQALAFVYALEADDIGTRSGPRAQISLRTADGVLEAFRDTAPSYRVKASIDRTSAVRHGQSLHTRQ
jgi:hypothetical protein